MCIRDRADDDEASQPGEGRDVGVQVLGAHDVEDDVRAVALGGLAQVRGPVVVVVDGDVGAQLAAHLELLLGAGGRRDGAAARLRVLDGERSDAARSTVNQEGLAVGQAHVILSLIHI